MQTEEQFKAFKEELDELLDKYDVYLGVKSDKKHSKWSYIKDARLSVISWSTKREFRLT